MTGFLAGILDWGNFIMFAGFIPFVICFGDSKLEKTSQGHRDWLAPVIWVAALLLLIGYIVAFRTIVIHACLATTGWHTVTYPLGTDQTNYKNNGEWCLSVRRTFE